MKLTRLIFVLAFSQVRSFEQNDYQIVHHNISLIFINSSYVKNASFVLFDHGKTQKRINVTATIVKDFFGDDITNLVRAYKITNGNLRAFPTLWNGNACDAVKYDSFGTGVANYDTNFTGCPIKKGHYYLTNGFLDDSKLPPHAPKGKYMMSIKVFYNKTILVGENRWYGEIQARSGRK